MFSETVDNVSTFSSLIEQAIEDISEFLSSNGCQIIFKAGDSVLAVSDNFFDFEELPLIHNSITFSAGISDSLPEAVLALKKAKGLGKRRFIFRNGGENEKSENYCLK